MKSRIETALKKHFERTRIVFWYDDKKEFVKFCFVIDEWLQLFSSKL